jgi:hypothetical protein
MDGAGRWLGGGKSLQLLLRLLLLFLHIELIDFGLDLGLEFVGGALEFVERLSDLASDLRQLLGAEDQQGQDENESGVAKTHAPIITEQLAGSNAGVSEAASGVFKAEFFELRTARERASGIEKRFEFEALERGYEALHSFPVLLALSVQPASAATY